MSSENGNGSTRYRGPASSEPPVNGAGSHAATGAESEEAFSAAETPASAAATAPRTGGRTSRSSHPLQVLIVGAGFSGLCLGYHLRRDGIEDFAILEKAEGLGGTWRDNSYPGACCDVTSLSYCFSFAQKTDWSRKWSPQPEILAYMQECAERFDLMRHIRFGSEVASAAFDEERGVWMVTTASGEQLEARYLVSGVGQLHRPFVPEIEGADSFGGIVFHSARWRHDVDLTGKRVAVIGNAASAIQFIPEVARSAGRVLVFQRTPNWMMRRRDRAYTEREKNLLARHPRLTKLLRGITWMAYEMQFPVFAGRRWASAWYRRMSMRYLEEAITDPQLRAQLTPDYEPGAKRILISDDYYETLAQDHVDLITERIERIDATGVVTADGLHHDADVIVYGTGFRTTEFLVPMQIQGREGRDLNEAWSDGAEAYLGISTSGFPNFFMMYGPNTNLGHNSIIFMIECQTEYIMDCIRKAAAAKLRWIDVRPEIQRFFNNTIQKTLQGRVWAKVGNSWYKNSAGRITNNWSGTTTEYWMRTRRADLSKYEFAVADVTAASAPADTCGEAAGEDATGGHGTGGDGTNHPGGGEPGRRQGERSAA